MAKKKGKKGQPAPGKELQQGEQSRPKTVELVEKKDVKNAYSLLLDPDESAISEQSDSDDHITDISSKSPAVTRLLVEKDQKASLAEGGKAIDGEEVESDNHDVDPFISFISDVQVDGLSTPTAGHTKVVPKVGSPLSTLPEAIVEKKQKAQTETQTPSKTQREAIVVKRQKDQFQIPTQSLHKVDNEREHPQLSVKPVNADMENNFLTILPLPTTLELYPQSVGSPATPSKATPSSPAPAANVSSRSRPIHPLRALLHPDDLRRLNIQVGTLIIIRPSLPEGQGKAIAVAWASNRTPINHIQIGLLIQESGGLSEGDVVNIETLDAPLAEAVSIELRSSQLPPEFPHDNPLNIYLKEILVDLRYIQAGAVIQLPYYGKPRSFRVIRVSGTAAFTPPSWWPSSVTKENATTVPKKHQTEANQSVCRVSRRTIVTVLSHEEDETLEKSRPDAQTVSYSSVGGLSEQIRTIRELIELPFKNPERFARFGLKPPKGVLLYGPPGTGKTLLARAVAAETQAHVIVVNGPEIVSRYVGETEAKLRAIFKEAEEKEPSIVVIDEIDALCPSRDNAGTELEKRIVATLLTLMDGAHTQQRTPPRIFVLGATNRPNTIDDALRRPGRFDRELEIGIPNPASRVEILKAIVDPTPNTLTGDDLRAIAAAAHGYVGADLAAVVREGGVKAIQRVVEYRRERKRTKEVDLNEMVSEQPKLDKEDDNEDDSGVVGELLKLTVDDLKAGLAAIRPSAMREVMLEVPKVHWKDIGGQSDVKNKLIEAIEWPLKHPEAFARFGIRPPKGILMFGPPGCSKTLMAKALATESGLNFIAVKGPELFSKWVGESEKAVREVFRKARAASPSIIFFDEIDALGVRRGLEGGGSGTSVSDRVLSQLLSEMDGIEPLVNVTVVAATNRPDILDSALLRPGRFDRMVYVGPPDPKSRREIFRIRLEKMSADVDVDVESLVTQTEGFSGAEVVSVCQEAALCALEENWDAEKVQRRHFEAALRLVVPRITQDMLDFFNRFSRRPGLSRV
ncbi:P-loop containing nucleoside triphosphate hydrolase protein [Cladochytrium replicatum]|nr:P-loop containing nucleoside triphosphate hydrolase protein [Cladochytrium replicatum]